MIYLELNALDEQLDKLEQLQAVVKAYLKALDTLEVFERESSLLKLRKLTN